jgi:glyoxylase-like metal-dependent hydrolase (beta-lactamase superfamily II)
MKMFILPCALFALTALAVVAQQDVRVVALHEDPNRAMEASVFASADQDTVKKYMPTGSAPASMSSFILFAGEDTVLIDAGRDSEVWSKKLTEFGVKPESIKLILITHFHGDHIGGLLKDNERRFPNAKVLTATQEYDFYLLRMRQPQGAAFGRISATYGDDFAKFKFDDEVFANPLVKVTAIDASGHTPGHAAFLIEPAKEDVKLEKTLIIGDLLHAAALQFPVPEACASFDQDKEKSVAARKRILDLAIQEKWLVGGMHFPPPSVGTVKKEGKGYALELKK